MQKSQQFMLLIMIVVLVIAFFTFILTYSLLPPKEQKVPHRSRIVIHQPDTDGRKIFIAKQISYIS